MSHVLSLTDLQFAWPNQALLLDIPQFSLTRGERLFLKGPSGSGKTTLLALLGGIQLPQQGQLVTNGNTLSSLSAAARDHFRADHMGYLFQQFNLLPFLDITSNVLLPCRFSKRRAARASERYGSLEQAARHLLEQLGLPSSLHSRRADELSIGQQQRVAAARALIGSPELIIADEPTSALDYDSREAFIRLLFAECSGAGASLLFVSHDQSLAPLFDRVVDLAELNRAAGAPACI
ncbi:ABC transporter ATP-binding protein [Atopomonas sediminilitoris]|uniref:ABC transporter ATP-binding protein n=1 Tax=Atopomonas sediminilitoris TaxID=2919919 RepID=UPI001F4E738A|nr:ABC transporter ATP-binding protein [Atopomonas sediminilitoris]MCJ8168453.1 ABC transporter ATP-binding protein [Atopomonas sediminilitoris]